MSAVEIVAEIGASHLGKFGVASQLLYQAKEAGADAVKVQCWMRGKIAADRLIESGPWAGRRLPELYDECWMPWDWLPDLFDLGKRSGIEVFASVFDGEALAFLESLGCPRYKIASAEIVDLPLITAVAGTGKPVILSTGMATPAEIMAAVRCATIGFASAPRTPHDSPQPLTLLKCVSGYPAPAAEFNLAQLRWLRQAICYRVGLSDHSRTPTASVVAASLGACMIEKHICLPGMGPDAGFALGFQEFREHVRLIREAEQVMGSEEVGPQPSEEPTLALRRSMWVTAPVRAGEPLTAASVASLRPAGGMLPTAEVFGRLAARDLEAGQPLRAEDVI